MILSIVALILAALVSVFKVNLWLAGTQWILVAIALAVYGIYMKKCDCNCCDQKVNNVQENSFRKAEMSPIEQKNEIRSTAFSFLAYFLFSLNYFPKFNPMPQGNINKWIDKKLRQTTWIWLPFFVFYRLIIELTSREKNKQQYSDFIDKKTVPIARDSFYILRKSILPRTPKHKLGYQIDRI